MSTPKTQNRSWYILLPLLMLALVFALTFFLARTGAAQNAQELSVLGGGVQTSDSPDDGNLHEVKRSHRLIVELSTPPLAVFMARSGQRELNAQSPDAQTYLAQIEAERATAMSAMAQALPDATVATYVNELEQEVEATYQITFNGFAVDPGQTDTEEARRILRQLPGVTGVYNDYAYYPDLYSSLDLIDAPDLWAEPEVGGRANAGAGVKFASVDGGIHHDAPMFDGTGWSYPPGYPLGETENTNGKIIVSRVYFRTWDPPIPEDSYAWPAVGATSHGVHTSSTAVGNVVTDAEYLDVPLPTMSGVAPGAWAMSYRVFYNSVTGDGAFYTAEGIAAIEDAVADGADVINNSWGGGPGSIGGEGDPLDTALRNAVQAGVFVSMSAGNAGPGLGTGDHPSEDYINVAATFKDGAYAAGQLHVTAPEPISPTLQNLPFQPATFGEPLPLSSVITYPFGTAAELDPANATGCAAFPAGLFDGLAAVISRGGCEFGVKVLNAENAGAEFAVIYNDAGDELITMGPGAVGDMATISSVFIGQTGGEGIVAWYDTHGAGSELVVDTVPFPISTPEDYVVDFSSRGPSASGGLKPDIAAPGANIMAQGYDPANAGTEAEHLGYGQVSGTSMASPHIAGSAAVILQARPNWTPAQIKSALMTTAVYTNIYNADGSVALPLDIGAGRVDLTNVTDPGVFLDSPSAGFGYVVQGSDPISREIQVTSAASVAQTYVLSTVTYGTDFNDEITSFGFSVSP
ncbi:MAG: S8 family serine peptidase, partial [Chloroflexi bacterium]|nr:S8 family serine peptidase [Chloroflexota bacterium]